VAVEAVGIRQITEDEVAATISSGAMAVVAAGTGASEAAAEWAVSAVGAGSEVPWVAVQWVGPG